MIADAFGLLLLNALWLAAGLGVTRAAGWWGGRGVAAALGVSYLAGAAAYAVLAQLLLVLGASMKQWEVVVLCLVLAAGVLVPRGRSLPRPRVTWLTAVIALVLAVLAVDLWFQPLWAYDSWTFWTPKAHALAALGGLDGRWFAQPELLNRDYPIGLPALEAAGFRFTGYETGLLDLQSWVFVVALLAAYAEIVGPRGPSWRFAIPLLVVLSPSLADQLAAAEADIPLAALFACAAALAYVWHRERDRAALVLFGVLAAGVVSLKAEGLPFVAVVGVVLAAAELPRWRAALAPLGAAVAAILVGDLPWRAWSDRHDIPQQASLGRLTDPSLTVHRLGRVSTSVRYLLEKLYDPRAWLLLVPLLTVLTVAAWFRRDRRETAIVAAVVVLCLATLVLAYWTSQFEIHYHLVTSARRVITGPLLAWAFLVPLLWGRGYPRAT
ncbi:MAG TPA: hypothetical protein VHC67_10120 [Gaiellaceae bacterium]|nr:hypothetical protein [Gaiellaceae bacterium]